MSNKKRTKRNHYSPVFANEHWTSDDQRNHYSCFERDLRTGVITKLLHGKGRAYWGQETRLYPQTLEDLLDTELENESAILYQKLVESEILTPHERMKWGQYILTQCVRTPSFFRYAEKAREINGDESSWKETIIGCQYCEENKYVACRNWMILEAHQDDFFIRTDNPVYMTGFLQQDMTTLFYPLTPKKCFVACSMPSHIPTLIGTEPPLPKQGSLQLEKGDAFLINFELSKAANRSIIMQLNDESPTIEKLILDTLGTYPQPPFLLHSAKNDVEALTAKESLKTIMSITDSLTYPERDFPFSPFFGPEFEMGINPFSVIGVTDSIIEEFIRTTEIER